MKTYRQGDIFFMEIVQLPKGAVKKDNVVAYGETTGHKHQIAEGDVLIKDGTQYVIAKQKTQVVHEEHKAIPLPKGVYQVRNQREYSPLENRRVMD